MKLTRDKDQDMRNVVLLTVVGDCNDADYVTEITKFDLNTFDVTDPGYLYTSKDLVRILIEAMKLCTNDWHGYLQEEYDTEYECVSDAVYDFVPNNPNDGCDVRLSEVTLTVYDNFGKAHKAEL